MCRCVHTRELVGVFFSVHMAQRYCVAVGKIKRLEGVNMSADLHCRMEVENIYINFPSQW